MIACMHCFLWLSLIFRKQQIHTSHHYAFKSIVASYRFTNKTICAIQIKDSYTTYTQNFVQNFYKKGAHGMCINMALQLWHIIINIILGEGKNGQ